LESVETPIVHEEQLKTEELPVLSPTLPEVSLGHSAEIPALESQEVSQNSEETN